MVFQSKPTVNGTYRLKILDRAFYLESVPLGETTATTPWMCLAALDATSDKQKWILNRSGNTWTIESAADNAGLIYEKRTDTYHGRGFPYPSGRSLQWSISEYDGKYSKISCPQNGTDCFDSRKRAQGDNAVHFWHVANSQTAGPLQCFVFELVEAENDVPADKMDIVFIQDATGSQQPYINAARTQIKAIMVDVQKKGHFGDGDLRFGLITFRDHKPQDMTMVSRVCPFTSDASIMEAYLAEFTATGGGDGPEAQADALFDAYNANWNDDAIKLVILITDSPPHGIEPSGDGFPDGCPCRYDPLRTASLMKDADIALYVIACEPTLSKEYTSAQTFYCGLVERAGGTTKNLVPLPSADGIAVHSAVAGIASRALVNGRLARQYGARVQQQAKMHMSLGAITTELHNDLSTQHISQFKIVNSAGYTINDEVRKNIDIWANASSVTEGKKKIAETNGNHITAEYHADEATQVAVEKEPINKDDVAHIVSKIFNKTSARRPINQSSKQVPLT